MLWSAPRSGVGPAYGSDMTWKPPPLGAADVADPRKDAARAPLTSEAVLDRVRWGERRPSAPDVSVRKEVRLEPDEQLRDRVKRAIGVPVSAGVAVLLLAVAGAVGITLMNGGGQAPAGVQGVHAPEEGRHAQQQGGTDGASRVSGKEKPAPAEPSAQKRLLVHVVGEVERPGVVELPAGSRVSDALAAAGGPAPAAELGAVNLARPLVDGEQLLVPNAESAAAGAASAPRLGDGGAGGGVPTGAGAGPVALNAASAESLQQLPGIGPSLAERIIAWRTEHGGFQSVDQLDEVPGIGAKLLERLRERVVV